MNIRQICDDLRRRYENTYVFIQFPDGDKSMFYIESIAPDRDRLARITGRSPDYGVLSINHGSAHRVQFKFPKAGVFQSGKHAIIFRRRVERQYRRGICDANSSVQYPYTHALGFSPTFDHETLSNAFVHQTYSLDDALSMLKTGRYISVALEDNFSISLSVIEGKDKGYSLFWWNALVATLAPDGKVTRIHADVLKQEIIALVEGK